MIKHYSRWTSLIVAALMGLVLVAACGGNATKEPSAADLMPNLAGYQVNNTVNLQNSIAQLTGGSALLSGQPEVAAAVAGVSGLMTCYQNAGAVEGRTYVNQSDLTKAGVVVIINRNVMTDPQTFLNCVAPRRAAIAPNAAIAQPCAKAYTLDKDNNQFYVGYAATNAEVCQAFCSALQGCTP